MLGIAFDRVCAGIFDKNLDVALVRVCLCALCRHVCFVEHLLIACNFGYEYISALRTAASCAAVAVNCSRPVDHLIGYGMTYWIDTDANETEEAKFRRKKPGTCNNAFT